MPTLPVSKGFLSVALLPFAFVSYAQHPANSNAVYQQLRTLQPAGDVIAVDHFELHRDAATLTLNHGDIQFFGPVDGKVTGAVFLGSGHFHLTPPNKNERHNLAILTRAEEFDQDFDQAVIRFTDSTAEEIRKASTGKGDASGNFSDPVSEMRDFQRNKLGDNFDLRILQDVLSPTQNGYFLAVIHGTKDGHLVFTIDPHGAPDVSPEEVSLMIWNQWGETFDTAFPMKDSLQSPDGSSGENESFRITHEDLDVTIERSGFLTGQAKVQLTALQDGVAVLPFALYPTLRVSQVQDQKGGALDFVQEKRSEDADFGVILPQPLKKGDSTMINVSYGGKDVIQNEGNSNYYPIARESWYPNSARGLGDYATYNMAFHVPKGLQLVATGTRLSESNDGKITTSEWKTDVPLAVVGFNLGAFAMKEANFHDQQGDKLTIDAYANTAPPDAFEKFARVEEMMSDGLASREHNFLPTGLITPAKMLPMQLSEGQAAAQIYTDFYGPIPFSKVALTQQFACNYGQSWPMLVYLPICGLLDTTQQHTLGLHPEDMYWKVVTAHEVAHQWWGQTVGFGSYRDQWMSEGFAQDSAGLYLQFTRAKADDYRDFWKEERKLLTEKNAMGFRPIDVGPLTMGFRLSSQKTGWNIYQDLVYPKGAYILHMLRSMMWSPKDDDGQYKAMMHDFLNTYRLRPATTEDFKAMVEKHMTPGMDLERNHTMDWFFNEYVYGTDLPNYHFETQIEPIDNGVNVHLRLVQSGVADNFKNVVPLYVELANGRVFRMGMISIAGNKTVDQTIRFPVPPSPIKKVWINYYYDVLCTES